MKEKLHRISNGLLSVCAGLASFCFTLTALLVLRHLDEKIFASLTMGILALLIVWIACERPNTSQGRAIAALVKRLRSSGDFSSRAPKLLREEMPALAKAVETLFAQVRSNIDDVQAMAMYDAVTSLPNRRYFKREGERMLASCGENGEAALLFIDLDGFKEVNDSLGHARGDEVLSMVAERLKNVVQKESVAEGLDRPVIARLSGDEFTLLFPAVKGAGHARRIAGEVLAVLDDPFRAGGQDVQIGASIGIALWPDHAEDLAGLMKASDLAMYQAKASGRSQTCLYDERLATAFSKRSEVEQSLRQALQREQFSLSFQPQICAQTGDLMAAEARLQWNHPLAMIPAEQILSIAEESRLIVGVGNWMIDAVTDQLARWGGDPKTPRLTFKVRPGQLSHRDFFRRLREAMQRMAVPPHLLGLELSETAAMHCSATALVELASLRADGLSIAVGNFGSGYSNFARLRELPIDRVKLDASLVAEVDNRESARTIVAGMIHMMHGLGLQVIADGVETEAQIDVLGAVGCDILQGRAVCDALPEQAFTAWQAERREFPLPNRA